VDRVIVKGKSEPVELFECENPCTPPNYPDFCARYKAAYDEYFLAGSPKRRRNLKNWSRNFPTAPAKRCRALRRTHPPPSAMTKPLCFSQSLE
jgi:hypothetical protein